MYEERGVLPQPTTRSLFPLFSPVKRITSSRGSVILIVLVTIMFATVALTLFIEKASNDLLVDAREMEAMRLRSEAYSALETTLGVLEDFRLVIGALHSPAEGWGDPLAFAHYEPAEGRMIDVQFIDESAKMSLPQTEPTAMRQLFESWGMIQADAQKLTDALFSWMHKDYTPSSVSSPRPEDYERGEIPATVANRSLHSFNELASIEYARTVFYDEQGEPNDLWRRFVDAFSLYSYKTPNINGGNPAVLASLGIQDQGQQKRVQEYLNGSGAYQHDGPGYFRDATQIGSVLGGNSPATGLTTQISALRIIITVHERRAFYRLNVVVAPQGGAKLPPSAPPETNTTAPGSTSTPKSQSASATNPTPRATANSTSRTNNGTQQKSLNYPFTILEIRENDETSSAPADAAAI